MAGRSIRGDALLACVKGGGGPYHGPDYGIYQLATGSILTEALLRRVVSIERGRLRPGPTPGEGALGELARQVGEERKPRRLREWLRRIGPWAQGTIEGELEEAGLARAWTRRILFVYREPRLEILDRDAQDELFRTIRDTFLEDGPFTHEAALLVLLLREVAMLQYMIRWTQGRRQRRRLGVLFAALPEQVQIGLVEYERWQPRDYG
jgi:hypothetical protein